MYSILLVAIRFNIFLYIYCTWVWLLLAIEISSAGSCEPFKALLVLIVLIIVVVILLIHLFVMVFIIMHIFKDVWVRDRYSEGDYPAILCDNCTGRELGHVRTPELGRGISQATMPYKS